MTDNAAKPASAVSTASRLTRRQLAIGGCSVALAAAAGWGFHHWTTGRFLVDTDNAYVRADVVTIAPRVAGGVLVVEVADNQRVRAGDVLARIDDRDYRMKVEQAEGALASAQAAVEAQLARIANLDARSTQQKSAIAQAAAAMAARQADARLADIEYRRQADLARQQVTSDQIMQAAEAGAHRMRASVAEAQAALAAAREQQPILATERAEATAELDKARGAFRLATAGLAAARLDLERTLLRAPVDGRVGQRTVRPGHYVEAGMPLMAVVPDNAYVVANYKETQTDRMRPGQPVRIKVDAFGGAVLRGHVDSAAPASGAQFALLPPDNATGNFTKIVQRLPLRIRIDAGQPRAADLRPGMSVETQVDTRDARS
ncbi:MAG: HlyD family secretion protein [Caulobacter sp.]|nr:HlyD family secretion protein [Caulobacter sp.]